MIQRALGLLVAATMILLSRPAAGQVGETSVSKRQHDNTGAVSITFDDGTINHFRVARPLLNERNLPETFYIVAGAIPGSKENGRFIGRPVEDIIEDNADEPTGVDNFFERASAIRYLGSKGSP